MHKWDTLYRYALFHDRWFETADAYAPDDEHLAAFWQFMPSTWRLRRMGMNLVATPPGAILRDQGWKLHVSASSEQSTEVLRRLLPVLRDANTHFKFLADRHLTHIANSKLYSRRASGKFVTVYPRTDSDFLDLAKALAVALNGLAGPYVLSDRRVPGSQCVSYRYGGFRAQPRLQPDGTQLACIKTPEGEAIPDVRNPYFSPPEWKEDPFGSEGDDGDNGSVTLAGGRFDVREALSFSNRGGVYRGLDLETGNEIIIKEARPFVELDARGTDAIEVLRKEYELLQVMEDTGYFAKPVAYFSEWQHAFLVEEYIEGSHLGILSIASNPLYRINFTSVRFGAYLERMRPLWVQLADAIAQAHDRGILLGDLSFTNVIVAGEPERIKIVDLEAAMRPGIDTPLRIYTRGLASERFTRTGICDKANDYYALGGIIFGSAALLHSFLGCQPRALARLLGELASDLGLPGELPALITDLRSQATADALDCARWPDFAPVIKRRIESLPLKPLRQQIPPPAGLTTPAREVITGERLARLRERAEDTLRGISQYILATADPTRDDRLFPADPWVFETNPMSVAYGACGVAHVLRRVNGHVPPFVRGWLLRAPIVSSRFPPGLYLGQAGIAWVFSELGYTELALATMREASRHELLLASPNVFTGAAGFGLACLHLWRQTDDQFLLDEAVRIGTWLAGQRRQDEHGSFWPDDNGDRHIGYAFGSSGISAFLLYLHLATGDPEILTTGRDALRFDLGHAGYIDGQFAGFPALADEDPEAGRVLKNYWDEGSAGVAAIIARYLTVVQDPVLSRALSEITPDARRKYAVLPQLFHGLAGLGDFLLDMWEFSGDADHLNEAWRVAEGVLLFRITQPEGFVFPGEQALRETTDLASGSAGVGMFLHRLLHTRTGARSNGNFLPDELLPDGSGATMTSSLGS
jgi:hypothetical protein